MTGGGKVHGIDRHQVTVACRDRRPLFRRLIIRKGLVVELSLTESAIQITNLDLSRQGYLVEP